MSSQDNIDESMTVHPGGSIASLNVSGNAVVAVFAIIVVSICIFLSVRADGRSERAIDQARLMERETRIMQDDLKFIRSYLSARGIYVPPNHEQAEEN